MKRYLYIIAAAAFLGSLVPNTLADSASELKARLASRVAELAKLKERKVIGEDLKGLLQVTDAAQATAADKQLVADENKDRGIVYQMIARRQGSTPEQVGAQRASAIHKLAKSGVMLQREDGTWYAKE